IRDIVAHGYQTTPAQAEVVLRIANGAYQVGSWVGDQPGSGTAFAVSPVPKGDVGAWVHLAGVYDGTAWRLYRNGLLVPSAAGIGAVQVGMPWAIGFASNSHERFFSGGIDEVRIWRTARTAAQIADGYQTRVTGAEPGLVGSWRPGVRGGFRYSDT